MVTQGRLKMILFLKMQHGAEPVMSKRGRSFYLYSNVKQEKLVSACPRLPAAGKGV